MFGHVVYNMTHNAVTIYIFINIVLHILHIPLLTDKSYSNYFILTMEGKVWKPQCSRTRQYLQCDSINILILESFNCTVTA
jgi:hypothetical protein